MSGWTKACTAIKDRVTSTQRVLVVEGDDDKLFVESLLTNRVPGAWEQDWLIGAAGGKEVARKVLEHEPQWLGLVDRDEWTQADVAVKQAALAPNQLHVLPRYCMESYFTVPSELWKMLDPIQQGRIVGGQTAFEAALLAPIAEWIRHGALWHAVNPLADGLANLGFKHALLDFTQAQQPDVALESKLHEWHDFLVPQPIMDAFHANLTAALTATVFEQTTQWIHGKKFFREYVNNRLLQLLGLVSQTPAQTIASLLRRMTVPADLLPVWQAIGLP